MLSEPKLAIFHQFIEDISQEELIYAKGFLDGYLVKIVNANVPQLPPEEEIAVVVKPHIIYATETGNAKKVALQLLKNFKQEKIQAKTSEISQFSFSKLQKEETALFIISTQGEGELPETAINFFNELNVSKENLDQLNFAVFGLGDSSYPMFCEAGVLLDEALAEKNAKRILPLVKADVGYQDDVLSWEAELKNIFKNKKGSSNAVKKNGIAFPAQNGRQYYTGRISYKIVLNDEGSNKETYHIEITPNEEVHYEPGDSLGIIPQNNENDIQKILEFFGVNKSDVLNIKNKDKTVFEWLQNLNIKGISQKNLQKIAEILGIENPFEKADLIDLLFVAKDKDRPQLQKVLEQLLPIAPRLYSISSSKEAHDGQVHLTVALNTFYAHDSDKIGLASGYLSTFPQDTEFEFYIDHNAHFKLPEDDKDMIMIGPGTGIAPFRSFIAERDSRGAEGKNWLFFGEQHFVQDFYYQTEIQEWLSTGTLTKLSTAFSRDQEDKIYVQDRIRENAAEFVNWLDNGAYLYICGQKHPMSKDVESAILEILSKEKNISLEKAKEYLEDLESSGRYHKDVY